MQRESLTRQGSKAGKIRVRTGRESDHLRLEPKRKSHLWARGIAGTAAWRHGKAPSRESSVSSAGVEFVVLWCYGPSILWIRLDGWFSRCRGRSPADWLSGRPCTKTMKGRSKSKRARTGREFSGVQESFKRCSREVHERESACWRVVLKQSDLDTAHRWLVESECRYGAESRPCPGFLELMSKWSNISLIPWKIQTYRFYICLVTHDAKV